MTVRHPYSGGDQELSLAEKYTSDAQSLELMWPRTACLLRKFSQDYERDSRRLDNNVEIMT